MEENLNQISSDSVDGSVRQRELYLKLETAEKSCVRSLNDSIKKLLMAMDTPSHVSTTLPYVPCQMLSTDLSESTHSRHVSSFVYDRDSVVERAPTRAAIVSPALLRLQYSSVIFPYGQTLLEDTIDDVRKYIVEQRAQMKTQTTLFKQSKLCVDRVHAQSPSPLMQTNEYSNRTTEKIDYHPPLIGIDVRVRRCKSRTRSIHYS